MAIQQIMAALGATGGGGGAWLTTKTLAATGGDGGWAGYTLRQLIPAAALAAGSKIRFTLASRGASFSAYVNAAYVQTRAASGDAYDFSATPVPVLVGGSVAFTLTGATSALTDAATIALDGLTDIILSVQFAASPATDLCLEAASGVGFNSYYKSGSDASTVNATGYTAYAAQSCRMIKKIEILQP